MKRAGAGRRICAGIFALIATACAEAPDAASEAPVDPEPGQYQITLGGAGLLKHAGTEGPHSYCLRISDRASFAHKLAQNYYLLHPACTASKLPREGNAIAGEIRCPVDPKMAEGASRFVYSGAVAKDAVRVEVQMKFDAEIKDGAMTDEDAVRAKLAMKAIEKARFVIEAIRTGECS